MNSVWQDYSERERFPQLKENIKTDVLIVGGGIAGLLCAYMLKERGVDCVLLEADRICAGTSANTTAKITLQHGLIYDKLIRRIGVGRAELYLQAHKDAMIQYERLCKGVDCDYERKRSYVYSLDDRDKIEREISALARLGEAAELSMAEKLPFSVAAAVCVKGQAQFNPLKFAYGIVKGVRAYENSKVIELEKNKAKTQHAEVLADKIIIATHFPVLNKHGGYFLKMYQHRSYVIALEGASDVDGMYVDESDDGFSFRNYKHYLLLGGGAHRTGKKGGGWRTLENFASEYYPRAAVKTKWAAQDCVTLDKMAYIGEYSKSTDNLYVATGFNKWGMTSSMLSAMILSDLLCKGSSEYSELFSPSRRMYIPKLASNALEAAIGLITPTVPRCPHLGCALRYNKDEHSWDCPCHGSRFTEDGKLIENPATDDKQMPS